jgi:hypothetical protein
MRRRDIAKALVASAGPLLLVKQAEAQSSVPQYYAKTPAEIAAGVTPANYSYPPGSIWRYGATGDGTTDDTTAVAALLKCGAQLMTLTNGTFLCSGGQFLAANRTSLICRDATLIVKDETGITSGLGLLNVSGDDNYLDLVVDGNGLGLTLLSLGAPPYGNGNRNVVRMRGSNMTKSKHSRGYESVVLVQGSDNTIWVEAHDCTYPASPSQPTPRTVTCQGGGSGTTIELLRGRNIQSGLTVGAHPDVVVAVTDLATVSDIGFYLLSQSQRVKIMGGSIRACPQPVALKGTNNEFCNMLVVDCASPTLEAATNVAIRNCHFVNTNGTRPSSILATRAANVMSDGVRIENCTADTTVALSALLHFSTGTVNNVRVIGGCYNFTFQSVSGQSPVIVTHTAGNAVTYKDVTMVLKDPNGVLNASSILGLDIPTVSEPSVYEDVDIFNTTAGVVREGTRGGFWQTNLWVRSRSHITNGGLYLGGLGSSGLRLVTSSTSPTAGTWSRGDYCQNNTPAADSNGLIILGWICTASGSPGSWHPCYVKTTSP